ncbi:protein interacting with APP tail-1 isoform X2 [Lasioglossum baleicum]|uniref:protein interacting with APP tail-1 isoform X2 n=2 Tax=Lasioglossum baleicum TaxID=434251 RepID=UPI003FCDD838
MAEKVCAYSPKSLYELSMAAIIDIRRLHDFPHYEHLATLPTTVMVDLYYKIYKVSSISCCFEELKWSTLKVFSKMLEVTSRRVDLLKCFEDFVSNGIRIKEELTERYIKCCNYVGENVKAQDRMINLGLRLGRFFSDAGCYPNSEQVLLECEKLCLLNNTTPENWYRTLECRQRLLHTQAVYCSFKNAVETYSQAITIWTQLQQSKLECNFAAFYTECSLMCYMAHNYHDAYSWSIDALKELKPTLPARVTVDVLRQAAKSCMCKREFEKAGLLIKQAVQLARQKFQTNHPVYTNALLDYGLYLLKVDCLFHSVLIYNKAVKLMKSCSQLNLHVALAYVDLAYATYVYEYDTGNFVTARRQIVTAISTMEKLLSRNNFLFASARRIYALILEEIVIKKRNTQSQYMLLTCAEGCHNNALAVTRETFGDNHAHSAKHYGNLGRLYQTMGQFEKAAEMHVRAIRIMEESLGPDDHDVALSLEHLASLYNFDMHRYEDAEKLYHRSIAIWIKLFGKHYSGLKYNYQGLLHLHIQRNELEKVMEYQTLLNNWRILRTEQEKFSDPLSILHSRHLDPIEDVIEQFFTM